MDVYFPHKKNQHVVILFNGVTHLFIARDNLDELMKKMVEYNEGKEMKFLARYEHVDSEDLCKISRAINQLNEGEKVDLERLLENRED